MSEITHSRVLKIALPIMLANMTIPLQGVVDTAVIGRIPSATPIAAVAVGAILLSALFWVFGFLRMGTAGLTAQAVGSGDREEVSALLSRALLVGAVGGLCLIPLMPLVVTVGFAWSPASDDVKALAAEYMWIRIWAAPAAVAIFGMNGWLGAQEKTRSMLALQCWMVAVNVTLSITLVIGFKMGVRGVALATFVADISGVVLGLWLCRSAFATPAWRDRARVFDAARLKVMALVNGDILIRSLLLESVFVSFVFYYSAQFGDVTLAATHVLLHFLTVMAYALDGFAFAAESLVGQAFGARVLGALRRSIKLTALWGLVSNLVFALVYLLAGGLIIEMLTTEPNVRAEARRFLPWLIIAPILGLPAWMLDGVFIGATRTQDMRNMMVISTAVFFAAITVLIPLYGPHGMWAALMLSFLARGLTLGLRYPALERAMA